ncbi:MAG: DUF2793 domain-containing protein [Alphaproteobacteria bacterium]|nr:DUF2793 domain-containing protein [Alphaproteobacteria bacterium]
MSSSTHLQLPYLAPAQAQKHVTVNESLSLLDRIVQLSVISATTSAQPGSPADGDIYILPPGKTGAAWGGFADHALAHYLDGAWAQITPRLGWRAFVQDENTLVRRAASSWEDVASPLSAAIAGVGANGLITRTGPAAAAARSIASGVGVSVSNGDGAAGDPTVAIDLTADFAWSGAHDFGDDVSFAGAVAPLSDNSVDLGSGSLRFATVYAATGTINTSDALEKTPLTAIPESLLRAGRALAYKIGAFQWRSAVADKGASVARRHIGVTAQDVRDAFLAQGEEPHRWGLYCVDQRTGRLSLRSDQVLYLMIAALAAPAATD